MPLGSTFHYPLPRRERIKVRVIKEPVGHGLLDPTKHTLNQGIGEKPQIVYSMIDNNINTIKGRS
jgi:hypothetical protein